MQEPIEKESFDGRSLLNGSFAHGRTPHADLASCSDALGSKAPVLIYINEAMTRGMTLAARLRLAGATCSKIIQSGNRRITLFGNRVVKESNHVTSKDLLVGCVRFRRYRVHGHGFK